MIIHFHALSNIKKIYRLELNTSCDEAAYIDFGIQIHKPLWFRTYKPNYDFD